MDKSKKQFLQLLSSSLFDKDLEFLEKETINWNEIYELCIIHKVVPMIYDVISKSSIFESCDKKLKDRWHFMASTTAFGQVHKINRFLYLYKELVENKVKPIVIKGITLSMVYPGEYKRNYINEEMIIKKEDLGICEQILAMNGFRRKTIKEERQGIYVYHCNDTGLYLQIYTYRFVYNSKYKDVLIDIFKDVWNEENRISININGVDIQTLCVDKHLLYIVLNALYDLKNDSIRIRPICDITMYISTYHYEINWNYIWMEVNKFGFEDTLVDFLQIAIEELGLDEKNITYPKKKSSYNINTTYLLEEILDGGIFGRLEEDIESECFEEDYEEELDRKNNSKSFLEKYLLLFNKVFFF